MVRVRPKVATVLRKTAHAIQMHCVLQGEWSVSTSLRKTEDVIHMHRVLQGKWSAPDLK